MNVHGRAWSDSCPGQARARNERMKKDIRPHSHLSRQFPTSLVNLDNLGCARLGGRKETVDRRVIFSDHEGRGMNTSVNERRSVCSHLFPSARSIRGTRYYQVRYRIVLGRKPRKSPTAQSHHVRTSARLHDLPDGY